MDSPTTLTRILFSGSPNGPLPGESELIETAFDSDNTDLTVYDYRNVISDKAPHGSAFTFYFEESEYAWYITEATIEGFSDVVDILEEGDFREVSMNYDAGPFSRLANNAENLQYSDEEYLEDFRTINDRVLHS